MNYQLALSDEAQRTIDDQVQWYEADEKRGGAAQANRWLNRLELALAKLSTSRQRYGLAPENGLWHSEVEIRQIQFRPWKSRVGWRVLFVVDEKQRVVTVLQVRHERRRWLFEAED